MATLLQLAPGMVVGGDFRVLEPLGSGGMGALYVAEQLSTGKRRALKVMHRQLLRDPRQRDRFVQEARVGSLIESDHVVEVIAAGVEEASGVPWIAMELLDGRDLADFVAEHGRLTPGETLAVMRQLCHALGAAHRAGVVHRDVKPENVFVARSRSATALSAVKVLDFGIAKVAAQAKSTATAAVGSPAWMAPEQTKARVAVTPSADVWAVGLITYWLLTGELYWSSSRDPEASIHALMREVLFDPLCLASSRAKEHNSDGTLPPGFDGWFARCVTRDPEERFADASQAFASLEPLLLAVCVEPQLEPAASERPSSGRISTGRISTIPIGSSGEVSSRRPAALLAATVDDPPAPAQSPESRPAQPSASTPAVATIYAEPSWSDDEAPGGPERTSHPSVAPPASTSAAPATERAAAAPAHWSATAPGTETPADGAVDEIPPLPLRSRSRALTGLGVIALAFVLALLIAGRHARREEPSSAVAQTQSVEPSGAPTAVPARSEPPAESAVATGHPAATGGRGSHASATRGPSPATATGSSVAGQAEPSASHRPFATPPETADNDGARRPAAGGPTSEPKTESGPAGTVAQQESGAGPARFDRAEAHTAVERQAAFARLQCWSLPGPRLIAADVVFGPSGYVERVALAQREQLEGSTTSCVRSVLRGARVHPYVGKSERVGVLISLL